ncbi:MAG: DnaJ domain-containing protein [Gammaproteobacteria bacterium]
MRTLILLIAVIALLLIVRFLYRQSSLDPKKLGRWLVGGLIGVLFLFLLVTGRLHWIFALAAAAVPAFMRLLPLIRYVPLLRNLYKRHQAKQGYSAGAGSSQSSTVQSAYLAMTLNHDSGDMDGEILQGQFKGQRLQSLSLPQLMTLLQELQHDQDSLSLLVAYLDRHHEDWREQSDSAQQDSYDQARSSAAGSGKMTRQEACDVLGLDEKADKQAIIKAHRRLMQKLHPDHGGSDYLAAKINLAKDILLDKN